MRVIKPSYKILDRRELHAAQKIEYAGRTAYKSEDKITDTSSFEFLQKITDLKHFPVLEFSNVHVLVEFHTTVDTFNEKLIEFVSDGGMLKYMAMSSYESNTDDVPHLLLISGTVRAWLELISKNILQTANGSIMHSVVDALNTNNPFFPLNFTDDTGALFSVHPDENIKAALVSTAFVKDQLQSAGLRVEKHLMCAVKFVCNRAVTHELVRHRPVTIIQECVAWDEEVLSFSGSNKWSMKRLYELFNTPSCGIARKNIRIRTKDSFGEIVPSQILNVTLSGEKELFRITTKNGRSLKTSKDHIYFTEKGEQRLKDISVGDRVWVNGKIVEFNWLYEEYLVKNRERIDIAKEIGMSDAWLGKLIRDYGLQKPKSQYPNRVAGNGIPGMHSDEGKARISERMSGEGNHRWIGDTILDGHSRARSLYNLDDVLCICGSPAVERHHIDRDSTNNDPSNIEFCCISCHSARHRPGAKIAFLDEVISIEPCGVGMTYDIEVDHPSHNFVVGGIVVHNSQRYCRYSAAKFGKEVTFIEPSAFFPCPGDFPDHPAMDSQYTDYYLWEKACSTAEEIYMMLIERGASPQAARTVLPNSCKTEIIIYATIEEWRHIFAMRVPPTAEPSMRQLMVPLEWEFFSEENQLKWE